jgi:hypothetical protein
MNSNPNPNSTGISTSIRGDTAAISAWISNRIYIYYKNYDESSNRWIWSYNSTEIYNYHSYRNFGTSLSVGTTSLCVSSTGDMNDKVSFF